MPTRPLSLALLLALAGCWDTGSQALGGDDSEDPTEPGALPECATATDCTGAAASCCECPTYAVSRASNWDGSCDQVSCDQPPSCSAAPACEAGQCVLRCEPVVCDLSCANGFAADALGCLGCVCNEAVAPPAECSADTDCVRVAADCCGCTQGGADTAVPAAQADAHDLGLGCSGGESCPGVDVCDPDVSPRCINGSCALAEPPMDPQPPPDDGGSLTGAYCGSPDLPPCPAGQVCVLNDPAAMDATQAGLGVCRTQ
ncbi:MAG TPA: hypothetical protein VL172_18460 [Kofleriaceae bacterium]|nr:hypothetical protein [Kofleriaceae bacterium]